MSAFWQQAEKFTVPGGGGTATFSLKRQTPLERLTVWAFSGRRVLTNMSFQVQVNGVNFNPVVAVIGAIAANVVFRSGGATTENDMIPFIPAGNLDPFDWTVKVTNNGVNAEAVTLAAIGVSHTG